MTDPALQAPRFLPMGALWSMPVPVACSLMAAAGGVGFTCGQCPLDRDGRVIAPGDGPAQAQAVAETCVRVLALAPGTPHAAMLVIYHTAPDAGTLRAMLAPFAAAFPLALLAPVRLPHFYYPGMMIEVDVHAAARPVHPQTLLDGAVRVRRADAGALAWVTVQADAGAVIAPALDRAGIDAGHLLGAHWFGAGDRVPADWQTDPGGAVRLTPGEVATGILMLAPGPVTRRVLPGGARMRTQGAFVHVAAHAAGPDLAQAATAVMDAVDAAGVRVMLKTTTHYVGGPTPDDLHANLAVRHARFPRPGPASTGVPVAGLAAASLALDLIGWVDSAAEPA